MLMLKSIRPHLFGAAVGVALVVGVAAAAQTGSAGSTGGGAATTGTTLTVRVSNVRVAQGVVHVDICSEAQFLHDCHWSGSAPATTPTTVVRVNNLPPGRYAAQVYHDRNSNGRVDRMLFGIPTEGVGFSNDAPIRFAPPHFADAAFQLGDAPVTIHLSLRYF